MNCADCKEFLVPLVEGLLTESEKVVVTSHVKTCPACRAELKELITLHNRLVKNGKALKETNLENDVMNKIIRIQNAKLKEAAATATESLAVRRKIMKSPITKFAAAAVIIAAALIVLYVPGGDRVAIARVLEKVNTVPTFAYRLKMNIEDMSAVPEGRIDGLEMQAYISTDIGIRMDAYLKDKLIAKTYIVLEEQAIYSVMPEQKKYLRMNLNDEIMEQMQKDNGDPRAMLKDFMEYETEQLGKSIIDGVEVKGIESHDPNIAEGMLGNVVGRIWVATESELPVKIEIEVYSEDGQKKLMDMTMDRFQWDIEIPESEFALNLPEDYELLAEVDLAAGLENIVEGLGLFAEFSGGTYPSEMSPMKVVQELQAAMISNWGGSPDSEPSQEDLQKLVGLQMGATMFAGLKKEGKDPAYYGDMVTTEFPQAVLMRWKTDDDDGNYNVILGDLTTKIVTPEELEKLEAAPLNPKPIAVKPFPADGTEGTVLEGLKLTWIPGAYATAHRVYFGADGDQLALLGEVTVEQAEPGELERGVTYYWRIDEVQADGSITAGDTWSFSTGSLVAHWKFDEGSGSATADSSGNGYEGTLVGDTAWTTGQVGGALVFDGNEDFVDIADSNDLNIVNQVTVAAWIKVDAFDKAWQAIVTKGDRSWRLQRNAGNTGLEFACSGLLVPGNRWGSIYGTVDMNDGQWHHAAGVYDGEQLSLYIDGKPDVSAKAVGKIRINDKAVMIGENAEKPGRSWNGLIDDVRIYSFGLTAEEVAALSKQ
ncbi:MAG: zf-HC2 domain-containing protein [Sedimentisphaerales bacterium]|nr:zf-HC2 domain-containing protein [Sedimentisphaerales bacterium]